MQVVGGNHITFLLLKYILDNEFSTHETLDWAKWFNQPMVLLTLNFAKTYDKVC